MNIITTTNFKHKTAGHCESGSTSNLFSQSEFKISEPMVFGIGSGLFFAYIPIVKMMHAPLSTFRIFPGLLFKRTAKNLGIDFFMKTYKDRKEAMNELDDNLSKGIPVGLQVGVYHLTYFPVEYRLHYNMHNCIAVAKDNGKYIISDSHMENICDITYEDLVKVRFPRGLFAPHGKMYYPISFPEKIDMRAAIKKGIEKNVNQMLNNPFPMIGVNGIKYLGNKIKNWPERLGEQTANYYLGQLLFMLEEAGSGGAGFRFIYGSFLKEAAELLNNHELDNLSKEMGETANLWRHFSSIGAKNCKYRGGIESSYEELSKILIELSAKEKNIFRQLKKVKI